MTTENLVATLARNIRTLMLEQGLTQQSLASLTAGAVSQKTVSNVVRGKGIQLQHLEPLAKALQVEPWRLISNPTLDHVRLLVAYNQADAAGRELIKQLVDREIAFSKKP